MIAPKSTGHVAILQGTIGYACGPILMIPPRVKGLCFVSFKLSSQAAGWSAIYDKAAAGRVISKISGHHHGSRLYHRHNNTLEHIVRFGAPGTGAPQECIGHTKGTKP
jgi:hypothetical protein